MAKIDRIKKIRKNDLIEFRDKLRQLQEIEDIEVLKKQLNKATEYLENIIIDQDREQINEYKKAIYYLMNPKGKNRTEKQRRYYEFYQEIKEGKLTLAQIEERFVTFK